MTKKKFNARILSSAVVIALLAATFSCTKVENDFGKSYIPDNERMALRMDTIYGIQAYLSQVDSFPVSAPATVYGFASGGYGASYMVIGSMKKPTFGVTRASWATQYKWVSMPKTQFGIAPVADSLVLILSIGGHFGDTSKTQTFNVYELTQPINLDSAYYNNMDMEPFHESEPLFTFDHKGAGSVRKRMTGPKVDALIARFLNRTDTYNTSADFFNEFKGLYIAPADGSDADATTLLVVLGSSGMLLTTHSFTDETASTIKDTVSVVYTFDPINSLNVPTFASFSVFQHDYTGTPIDLSKVNDTLPTSEPVSLGYVQGAGGINTYLRFTDDFVKTLKEKIIPPYTKMIINRATIEIAVDAPTPSTLDDAVRRLGFYVFSEALLPSIDYLYSKEVDKVVLPYGGYLSRTQNSYKMDVSRMVQAMVMASEPNGCTLTIAPSFQELYGQSGVVLKTGSQPTDPQALRVLVTYTLMQ